MGTNLKKNERVPFLVDHTCTCRRAQKNLSEQGLLCESFFPVSALIPGDTGFLHELPQENRKLGKSPFRQSWYFPEDCGVTFSHYGFQRTR